MNAVKQVAILGVGLIGGSLGRAWKTHRPELQVVGYDRPEVLNEPSAAKAIDVKASSAAKAVENADVVVLATPIGALTALLKEISPHLQPGAVVTDVSSVKAPITRTAAQVLDKTNPFIGGHPMAGAEESGIAHADAFLFENATYVLCPPSFLSADDLQSKYTPFIELIESTGARVRILEAKQHDQVAARVSHVPQLLAVALMNQAIAAQQRNDAVLQLAAGGFRDMTRIASSSFGLWHDILASNRRPITEALDELLESLEDIRATISHKDVADLETAFEQARETREQIPKDTKGFLHPISDVYVYAEDKPGFLSQLTTVLYKSGLNIKDIELLKIREGTGGAFRVGFASAQEADDAVQTLQNAEYTAYRL